MKLTKKQLKMIINESLSESLNEGFFDGVKNFFGFNTGAEKDEVSAPSPLQGELIVAFAVNMSPVSTVLGYVHYGIDKVIAKEFSESEQSRGLASLLSQLQNPGVLAKINNTILQAHKLSTGVTMPTITGVYAASGDNIRLECDLSKGDPYLIKKYKLELTPINVSKGFKQVIEATNTPSYALPQHMPVDGRIEQLLCHKLFFYQPNPRKKFKR